MSFLLRGQTAPYGGALPGGPRVAPAPLLMVSVGTTGVSRVWRFIQRMTDVGQLPRIQSACLYDYNQSIVYKIKRRLARSKGNCFTDIHRPLKVRAGDGFLLDLLAFCDMSGAMEEDLDALVKELQERANDVDSPPQLMIEFFGFGGHAVVGLILHKKLRAVVLGLDTDLALGRPAFIISG